MRSRYQQASYREKQGSLGEYIQITGYDRKSALRNLHQQGGKEKKTRRREVKYDGAVKKVVEELWQLANRICSKRLVPLLTDFIPALEKFGHLALEPEVRKKVLSLSAATTDRLYAEIARLTFHFTQRKPTLELPLSVAPLPRLPAK